MTDRARTAGIGPRQYRDARERLTYSVQKNGFGGGWTLVLEDQRLLAHNEGLEGHLGEPGAASGPDPGTKTTPDKSPQR